MPRIDKVRAEETARVTERVLEEIGIDAPSQPPMQLLIDLIKDVSREMGIELTDHEVWYVAAVNIKWVFKDIDEDLAEEGAARRRKLH